ncbi:bifunctional enoyl-CoA hydratase/phosphate acetyltransferase [Halarsenatibacter silvermanii]|uniref:Phosphate butyryltransferase n=1 Tax=Halarsenatibacter silvermanii TaxID=321763 RepID=A0A1G9PKQ7_9FIRM|nr:bifunctional enoyl-CoA hydratase/phosphate acetyltransferase [Halarsenatibacter silvermanii]SDL99091.1 phosphate butyryltransferase [Halarsenatibacter silvermanii]
MSGNNKSQIRDKMYEDMNELIQEAAEKPAARMTVAAAGDKVVLEAVLRAAEKGIIEPVLIGDEEKIAAFLRELGAEPGSFEIIGVDSKKKAADNAVERVARGEADFPMKGLLGTSLILRSFLDSRYGFKTDRLLSLVTLMELNKFGRKMVFLSDAGMNISPSLAEKADIIRNSVELARRAGLENPRVAPLAAVEKVNDNMPVTEEAAILSKMSDRGQLADCTVDGPLALDNAISKEAAEHKGIESPVAGRADILLVPNIEVGNVLYKALIYYGEVRAASVVMGAEVPAVVSSRADSAETKFNSIALAKLVAQTEVKN